MSAETAPATDEKTRYEAAKKELAQALMKKRQLDKQLLEVQIYNTESAYLTETYTQGAGNIITGFDNYLKNQNTTRRRNEVTEADRLFSNSSTTYQKSLDLQGEGEESPAAADDNSKSANGSATISLPPARTSDGTASKKERDKAYQRRRRASRQQSVTGLDSDEESVTASVTSSRRPSKRARIAEDE